MTPQQHNKYLGIAHLAFAAFELMVMIVTLVFVRVVLSDIFDQPRRTGSDPSPEVLGLIFVFALALQIAFSVPSIVAAYAFLKQRSWAKTAGIVGGVVAAISFPIGSALAVYTFWFLFSDAGKQLYDPNARVLQPPSPPLPPSDWQSAGQ